VSGPRDSMPVRALDAPGRAFTRRGGEIRMIQFQRLAVSAAKAPRHGANHNRFIGLRLNRISY
jgi:hypothetical protein